MFRSDIQEVLDRCYSQGLTLQSDWARQRAQAVAACASMGLISTYASTGYGKVWRVTVEGLKVLEATL